MKIKSLIAVLLTLTLTLCGCSAVGEDKNERLSIVATNFVCYDFARQIVGEKGDVTLLIDPGTEVHAYEPSPADIMKIGGSDLFIYIGGESDVWANEILDSFGDQGPRSIIRLMDAAETVLEEAHDHEEEHDGHDELEYDEHIWTSPKNAAAMVEAVRDAVCAADPANADTYTANADAYAEQIRQIDQDIGSLISESRVKTLVFADRFPFLYFVDAYGLDYAAAYPTCARNMEPSAQTISELIKTVQTNDIRVIYIIEMSSGSVAKTIADETGAEIMTMYSCQNVTLDDFNAGESYVSLMRKNVETLKRGLN